MQVNLADPNYSLHKKKRKEIVLLSFTEMIAKGSERARWGLLTEIN